MGVIGGPSKSLKTSILIDLAISLASGNPFLGRFPIPEPMPVALISGESGRAVDPGQRQAGLRIAKGIPYEAAAGVSWGFGLPALTNPEHLAVLRKAIRDGGFKVVMIDPLYMSLLAGNVEVDAEEHVRRWARSSTRSPAPAWTRDARRSSPTTSSRSGRTPTARRRSRTWPSAASGNSSGNGCCSRGASDTTPRPASTSSPSPMAGSAGHAGEMHLDIDTGQITEDLDRGRKWSVTVSTPSEGRAAREEQEREMREAREAEKATLADQRAEQTLLANVGKVVEAIRALTAKRDQAATVRRDPRRRRTSAARRPGPPSPGPRSTAGSRCTPPRSPNRKGQTERRRLSHGRPEREGQIDDPD